MTASTYSATVGTEEEGRMWVGVPQPLRPGGVAVNEGMVRLLCHAVQDANPRYWEGAESPPSMLFTWVIELPWTPQYPAKRPILAVKVPLPGDQVINVKRRVEFYEVVRFGDQLSMTETIVSISDEKTTALGRGHFVVTEGLITRQDGTAVGKVINNLFRYRVRND
jgi:hypothetical protein